MATYDYMEKGCSLWRDTGGHCCPDGTHQKDCVYVQERKVKEEREITMAIFAIIIVGVFISWVTSYLTLWWLVGV